MKLTITNPPVTETNPWIIVRVSEDPYDSATKRFDGELARVNVKTGADFALIKMLRHQIDYFAPATGHGLLVKPELLKR